MVRILVMADDFTGALDTGVQFTARGERVRVGVYSDGSLEGPGGADVLVADTETRHLSASDAYDIVFNLTKAALARGVRYIYKKTDSGLRGNIGAELSAVLNASGKKALPFLPAYPEVGRVTIGGVHYISGVPVTKSPFGSDPFEPVRYDSVTDLIASQSDVPARSFPPLKPDSAPPEGGGIWVFDAESVRDLENTGRCLYKNGDLDISAGCAGFAAVLPEIIDPHAAAQGVRAAAADFDPRMLVICGSVNPISVEQMNRAERAGFVHLRLTPEQKLTPHYWESAAGKKQLAEYEECFRENPHCIIDTNGAGGNAASDAYAAALGLDGEATRSRIAQNIGELMESVFSSPSFGTLVLVGGDTLFQCLKSTGVAELEPVRELDKGIVLTRFTYAGSTKYVITKSGGFGDADCVARLAARGAKAQRSGGAPEP